MIISTFFKYFTSTWKIKILAISVFLTLMLLVFDFETCVESAVVVGIEESNFIDLGSVTHSGSNNNANNWSHLPEIIICYSTHILKFYSSFFTFRYIPSSTICS